MSPKLSFSKNSRAKKKIWKEFKKKILIILLVIVSVVLLSFRVALVRKYETFVLDWSIIIAVSLSISAIIEFILQKITFGKLDKFFMHITIFKTKFSISLLVIIAVLIKFFFFWYK